MNNLFLILFFGSLFAFIAGIVKPRLFANLIKNASRVKLGIILGLCTILFLGFYGMTLDNEPQETSEVVNNSGTALNLEQRKQICWDITEAQDRANVEAEKMFPTNAANPEASVDNVPKMVAKSDELSEIYEAEVREKHDINEDVQSQINIECAKEEWPLPEINSEQ
jgi:hypothetical protein